MMQGIQIDPLSLPLESTATTTQHKVQQVETRLYCAAHCHICDEAKSMLSQAGIVTHPVDIIENDKLFQKYRLRIPVLQRVDNNAELDWPFDNAAILRFLIA